MKDTTKMQMQVQTRVRISGIIRSRMYSIGDSIGGTTLRWTLVFSTIVRSLNLRLLTMWRSLDCLYLPG